MAELRSVDPTSLIANPTIRAAPRRQRRWTTSSSPPSGRSASCSRRWSTKRMAPGDHRRRPPHQGCHRRRPRADRRAGLRCRRVHRRHAVGLGEPRPDVHVERRHLAGHRDAGVAGLERAGHRRCAGAAGPHRRPPQAAGQPASGHARRHGRRQHAERGPAATIARTRATSRRRCGRSTGRGRASRSLGTKWPGAVQAPHPVLAAKFDDDLARAYGVTWEDDLFAPPARTAAPRPMSTDFSVPSRSGCRTTCRPGASCCRPTTTAGRNCQRRPR